MSAKEKQALHNAAFAFLAPLTNGSPASAGSRAKYQLQQKLLKAKELLTSSSMNISEIAYSLKFENAGQFSTFFKKKEGVTPSEFRERAH